MQYPPFLLQQHKSGKYLEISLNLQKEIMPCYIHAQVRRASMGTKEEMTGNAEVIWITTTAFSSDSLSRWYRIRESEIQTAFKEQIFEFTHFRAGEQDPEFPQLIND